MHLLTESEKRDATRFRTKCLFRTMLPNAVRVVVAIAVTVTSVSLSGCAGYQVGQATLYQNDIQTVHVPIFKSSSFRRNLGERLTEAVVRRIHSHTPYIVVGADEADSILEGRIIAETKHVIAEDRFDFPRVIEANLVASVEWRRPDGQPLGGSSTNPQPFQVRIGQASQLIPEAGQSLTTAHQKVIEKLAADIVAQMEMPW